MNNVKNRTGFSLLELMILCGIITLLITCLVPHLTGAHEAALSALCKTRLRNLAMAANTYATEVGYYPWGMIDPNTHDDNYYTHGFGSGLPSLWPDEMCSKHGIETWKEYQTYCWDFRKKAGETWQCGRMMMGINNAMQFKCPKCKGGDNWDGNPMTGYNYNVAYIGYVENDAGCRNYPLRRDSLKYPDRVVIFGDGGYSGGANKFMRATKQDKNYDGSSASLRKAGTQAFRHGEGRNRHCNMVFADCHVEEFRQPYTSSGKKGWVDEKEHTAFISSGNGIYGPRGWGETDDFTE